MATLFTTTNIIVSGILRGQDLPGFGVLDFARLGIPIVIAGILYMALWGRRRLPWQAADQPETADKRLHDLVEIYRLGERLFRVCLPSGSCFSGQMLKESGLQDVHGVYVVGLERQGRVVPMLSGDTTLIEGDILILEGKLEEFREREVSGCLEFLPARDWRESDLEAEKVAIVEAVLAPRSTLLGQTLRTAHFREKYGMAVAGNLARRAADSHQPGRSGAGFRDALLLQGPRAAPAVAHRAGFDLLDGGDAEQPEVVPSGKRWLAVGIMGAALLLAGFNTPLIGEIMLALRC